MNGQRGFSNGFFIDGATAEWQYYGKQSSTLVQDWIQEFQVMTNSFSTEFDTAAGGILNVITRSGTNRFQGRGYAFFRDAKFDSAPFAGSFTNGRPDYLDEAAPFSQQRVGGFLGGPILRNRLFFFAGVEKLKKDSSEILGISDMRSARRSAPIRTGTRMGTKRRSRATIPPRPSSSPRQRCACTTASAASKKTGTRRKASVSVKPTMYGRPRRPSA